MLCSNAVPIGGPASETMGFEIEDLRSSREAGERSLDMIRRDGTDVAEAPCLAKRRPRRLGLAYRWNSMTGGDNGINNWRPPATPPYFFISCPGANCLA